MNKKKIKPIITITKSGIKHFYFPSSQKILIISLNGIKKWYSRTKRKKSPKIKNVNQLLIPKTKLVHGN